MTTTVGTLSATPALDLVTALEMHLPTQGWVLHDTQVLVSAAQNNGTYRIWRNPAANNSNAVEFFIALYRSADNATVVQVLLFEGYSTATKVVTRHAPTASTGTAATDYSVAGTTSVEATNLARFGTLTTLTAGQTFFVSVSRDRVMWSATTATGGYVAPVVAGCFESWQRTRGDTGLIVGRLGNVGLTSTGTSDLTLVLWTTRDPYIRGAGVAQSTYNANSPYQSYWMATCGYTALTGPATAAEVYSGRPVGARPIILGRNDTAAQRGWFPGLLYVPITLTVTNPQNTSQQMHNPAAPVYLDTLTYVSGSGDVRYVYIGGQFWYRATEV